MSNLTPITTLYTRLVSILTLRMPSQKSTTTMVKPCFVDLPFEIRQLIYTHLFENEDLPLRVTRYGAIDKSHWPHPLSLTCRQFYQETSPLIQDNEIKLQCDNGMYPRNMRGKLPDHISNRIRIIHVARTAQALMHLPAPSRATFPNLEEIIVDFEGLGRCHGRIGTRHRGESTLPDDQHPIRFGRGSARLLADADPVSWTLEGKPIDWLEAQNMIKHSRASHMRRVSGARGLNVPASIGRGAWDRNARL